jgi:hypothetical protein
MIVTGSLKTIVQIQVVSLENLLPPVQVNAHTPSLARPFGEAYLATKWHVFSHRPERLDDLPNMASQSLAYGHKIWLLGH